MKIKEIMLINTIIALTVLSTLIYLVLQGLIAEAIISLLLLAVIALNYSITKIYMKLRNLIKAYNKIIVQKKELKELLRKPRRRYLIFRVVAEKEVDRESLRKALLTRFRDIIGDLGLSQVNIKLILYEPKSGYGVLRYNHLHRDLVLLCLALIRNINGTRVSLIPYRTTGTIKRAQEILKSLILD